MDNLKFCLALVKQGMQYVNEKENAQARKCYSYAMKQLVRMLISEDTTKFDSLKKEVIQQIEFCLKSLDELDILDEKNKPNAIKNRIESTDFCKKSNLKFSDVCGMETEKNFLAAAVILPVKYPDSFTNRKSMYRAFLFYGV